MEFEQAQVRPQSPPPQPAALSFLRHEEIYPNAPTLEPSANRSRKSGTADLAKPGYGRGNEQEQDLHEFPFATKQTVERARRS